MKSYIPAINTSIFPKKQYENIFTEKLINELHSWVESHPHVIHSPNVKVVAITQYFDILCSRSFHISDYNCIEKFLENNIDHESPVYQVEVKIFRFY